ncbi:MAG TPA: DUF2851 family protein [Rariglobus sp.]
MSEPESDPSAVTAVAEVQGLYGTFSFPERLLQKIWMRGDFDANEARLADGRPIRVTQPGRWNHLGGPDFAGARLVIGGREIVGDVELHLHAKEWAAHGHAADHAYDNVVLHVVLFPCAESSTPGAGGRAIPVLCLLPLLHHGLEEYAADEAMEQLAGRPLHQAQEALGRLGREELDTLLRVQAERRWAAKVHFAGGRIKRLGWEAACHHAALEVLGYRFNRAPMLTVATARPLADWAAGAVDPSVVFADLHGRWSLQGVRPLNHPHLRLKQYAAWCAARPGWPGSLRDHGRLRGLAEAPFAGADVAGWRREAGLTGLRCQLQDDLCGGAVGGSRWDNMVCDGFLPLLAAVTGVSFGGVWSAWFAGDAPEAPVKVLKALEVFGGRNRPVSQGPVQGLLGWLLARETESHE